MPPLANPRQELFCQNIVKGMNKTKAYKMAGYEDDRHHASRLATYGHVKERCVELFNESIPEMKWTREEVNHQYTDLLIKLKRANKLEAAKQCVDSIARVNGLIINRYESGKAGEFDGLSDHELLELIATPLGEGDIDGV